MVWDREAVELGIMNGLPGLETLFKRVFPRAQTQRCQKHAKANACLRVRKAEREAFSKDVNRVFYAMKESQAKLAFHELKDQRNRQFHIGGAYHRERSRFAAHVLSV